MPLKLNVGVSRKMGLPDYGFDRSHVQRRVRAGRLAAQGRPGGVPRPGPPRLWRRSPGRPGRAGAAPGSGHAGPDEAARSRRRQRVRARERPRAGQWRGSPRRSDSGRGAQARQARHGEPGQGDPLDRPAEGRRPCCDPEERVRRREARGPDAAASLRPHRLAQGRGIAARDAESQSRDRATPRRLKCPDGRRPNATARSGRPPASSPKRTGCPD